MLASVAGTGDGRPRWRFPESAVWCAAALVLAGLQLPLQRSPCLSDDSFQYLSVAKLLRSTHQLATPLVHFDTERSHGTIPAPLTWFPPGYPAAIALVSTTGLSCEHAALLISIASFVLVTGGLWRLTRALNPSRWVARAAVLGWLANSHALQYSVSACSELLFTVLGLGSVLFLVQADETGDGERRNGLRRLGSAILAGASYWVRYAGILWALSCLALLWAQFAAARSKRRATLPFAIAASTSVLLLLAPVMIRNVILVGDWRGGNNTPASMSISVFVRESIKLAYHLILGSASVRQLWLPTALMSIGLLGLCVTTFRAWGATHVPPVRRAPGALVPVLGTAAIYIAGIAMIAMHSVISYAPRMFVPVLPHLLALGACGIATLARRIPARIQPRTYPAMLACVLLGYVSGNVISRISLGPDQYAKTQRALLAPDEAGRSIRRLLDEELKPGDVIAATNGQAAGYILNHPALSLVGRPYGTVAWNAPELRAALTRYGAAWLLVFRDAELDPVVGESPLLAGLAAGRGPPWLDLAGSNGRVYVYKVRLPGTPDATGGR
jgi:hypothetical protein